MLHFGLVVGTVFPTTFLEIAVKKIDFMLPWVCSLIDQGRRQNVVKKSVVAPVPLTLFLPHFFVLCDVLLNMTHSNMESIC